MLLLFFNPSFVLPFYPSLLNLLHLPLFKALQHLALAQEDNHTFWKKQKHKLSTWCYHLLALTRENILLT